MKSIVIGAGISGLMAARSLADAGSDVIVFDKGRSVGGRMATRRIADARLDHGAQFFTARSPEFSSMVSTWVDVGLVRQWCTGFSTNDGHPRYVGTDGMTSIAKHLARNLDVRCGVLAFSLRRADGAWELTTDDGHRYLADSVVVSAPIPQAFALLAQSEIEIPEDIRNIDYDRTIGLLVVADGTHALPPPGGMQNPDEVFSFIADNHAKGISRRSALTFHANANWSLEHYDMDLDSVADLLLTAANPYMGSARILECQVKKWRFATPRSVWPEACWVDGTGTLALAGDAFAGPRIEGAALSGLAAAFALLND